MDNKQFIQKVLKPLKFWPNLGETTNEMGTRLIGHVPHIAPKAYLHIVYAPIDCDSLDELENHLDRPIPMQLRQFFQLANGIDIFSGCMNIEGYVPYDRNSKIHPYNYPANIVISNTTARITGLSDAAFLVGFYKTDGSRVSIEADGRAVRFDSLGTGEMIKEWPDFDTWVCSEIEYLSQYYDENGKLIANPNEILRAH